MVLVLLQNAWSGYWTGREWPREYWLESLAMCRTGHRLRDILPIEDFDEIREGTNYWVDNTTPLCGPTARSVVKPDMIHVTKVLNQVRPNLVVACGKQAQDTIDKIGKRGYKVFSRIYMPHPAMRLLTNECCAAVNRMVADHLLVGDQLSHKYHFKFDPCGKRSSI